jgi:uncharacterized protein YjhX (UPF0386 family)
VFSFGCLLLVRFVPWIHNAGYVIDGTVKDSDIVGVCLCLFRSLLECQLIQSFAGRPLRMDLGS